MKNYTLIRSNRRTISVQIQSDGSYLVRAPIFCPASYIDDFLLRKKSVLERKRELALSQPATPSISKEEFLILKKKAEDTIPPRVKEWSEKTGFDYQSVRITSARHRFGSCSNRRRLCFSAFLMLAKSAEIDYVIVHELCHTVELNHSSQFYALVEKFIPDRRNREQNLRNIVIPEISE